MITAQWIRENKRLFALCLFVSAVVLGCSVLVTTPEEMGTATVQVVK